MVLYSLTFHTPHHTFSHPTTQPPTQQNISEINYLSLSLTPTPTNISHHGHPTSIKQHAVLLLLTTFFQNTVQRQSNASFSLCSEMNQSIKHTFTYTHTNANTFESHPHPLGERINHVSTLDSHSFDFFHPPPAHHSTESDDDVSGPSPTQAHSHTRSHYNPPLLEAH